MILHGPGILLHLSQNLLHNRILQYPQNLWIPLCPLQNLRFRSPSISTVQRRGRSRELLFDFAAVGAGVWGVGVGCAGSVTCVDGFLVFPHGEVGCGLANVGFDKVGVQGDGFIAVLYHKNISNNA